MAQWTDEGFIYEIGFISQLDSVNLDSNQCILAEIGFISQLDSVNLDSNQCILAEIGFISQLDSVNLDPNQCILAEIGFISQLDDGFHLTGGFIIGGESLVGNRLITETRGGFIVGGTSLIEGYHNQDVSVSILGGLILGGLCTFEKGRAHVSSGGFIIGGRITAEPVLTGNLDVGMSGGLIVSGNLGQQGIQNSLSGGFILGGSLEISVDISCSGGFIFGGILDVESNSSQDTQISGGFIIGGNSDIQDNNPNRSMYGGFILGGIFEVEIVKEVDIQGGFIIGGRISAADNSNSEHLLFYIREYLGEYSIWKKASSDFLVWDEEIEINLGLPSNKELTENINLSQLSNGVLVLTLNQGLNIYISYSEDFGNSWTVAQALTDYTQQGVKARHPCIAENTLEEIYLSYNKELASLLVNATTPGWDVTYTETSHEIIHAGYARVMHYDEIDKKLYLTISISEEVQQNYSRENLAGIIKLDVPSWKIDRCWSHMSTPAINPVFRRPSTPVFGYRNLTGVFLPTFAKSQDDNDWGLNAWAVAVFNGTTGEIKHFAYPSIVTREGTPYEIKYLPKNVNWTPKNNDIYRQGASLFRIWFHEEKLYLYFAYPTMNTLGYISLNSPPDIDGQYVFNELYTFDYSVYPEFITKYNDIDHGFAPNDIYLSFETNEVLVSCSTQRTDVISGHIVTTKQKGALFIHDMTSGSLIKLYTNGEFIPDPIVIRHKNFPFLGLNSIAYSDGTVYGIFNYKTEYYQENLRGLLSINTERNDIISIRPTWASYDDYLFTSLKSSTEGRIFLSSFYGVTIYDPVNNSWKFFDNASMPGLTPSGKNSFIDINVDENDRLIFAHSIGIDQEGTIAFSEDGLLKQTQYQQGTFLEDKIHWLEKGNLVKEFSDYDASIVFTAGIIYAFWTNTNLRKREDSIKWDEQGVIFDLAKYTIDEISTKYSIGGNPYELSFSLSHGHLFDQHNLSSFMAKYVSKGRSLEFSLGEKILGTDYFQQQGLFYVVDTMLSYEKNSYPTMRITAYDERKLWENLYITATEFYDNNTPGEILISLFQEFLGKEEFAITDISDELGSSGNQLKVQWVDIELREIVRRILNRFGYFLHVQQDGLMTVRRISNKNAVNHIYSDITRIINFTPDDNYSDFTTEFIVVGQEKDSIEILLPLETITSLSGTVGWWGGTKKYKKYYSEDHKKKVRNTRLVVLETAENMFSKMGLAHKVTESITETTDFYCVVTIELPDLIPILVSCIAVVVALFFIGDIVVFVNAKTYPVGTYMQMAALMLALQVLSSVSNFQFEIQGNPVGKVRRNVQNSPVIDYNLVKLLGFSSPKRIEEPLCYTPQECQIVAEQELMISKLQRKRVKFTKLANLQDEIGDTIEVPHPYTKTIMKIYITELTRVCSKDKGLLDEIEGWVIE